MKAALIGYGYWGKIIKRYLDGNSEIELVKICTRTEHNDVSCLSTTNYQEVLDDKSITAVFICTPIRTHFDLCKKALAAGKHVFCEKPTVPFAEQFDTLRHLADLNKRILYTDYIYTISPSIRMLKGQLSEIGTICCVEGEISQFGNFYPGDTVYEVLGVHLISVLASLLPDLRIKSCKCNHVNGLAFNAGSICATVNQDIQVLFVCNLLSPQKSRKIKVYGTKGCLIFDMLDPEATLRLFHYRNTVAQNYIMETESKWKFDENNNLTAAIHSFCRAVAEENNDENLRISKAVCEFMEYVNKSINFVRQ